MGEGEQRVAIIGGGISGMAAAERLAALELVLAFAVVGNARARHRAARDAALGDALPAASTLVIVAALANPQWLVEIEAVATV